jgi:hypothetical protein
MKDYLGWEEGVRMEGIEIFGNANLVADRRRTGGWE